MQEENTKSAKADTGQHQEPWNDPPPAHHALIIPERLGSNIPAARHCLADYARWRRQLGLFD